jgi:predicted ATPase
MPDRVSLSTAGPIKIVLTGAPGSGKSTIARELARRDPESFIVVPEAATQYYTSLGFRWDQLTIEQQREAQRGIYRLQIDQEQRLAALHPEKTFLMDRGTIDGAAYWPDGPAEYWRDLRTTESHEIARYAMVIVLESSAAIGLYDGDASNQVRFEDAEGALENAKLLGRLWAEHPNTHFVRAMRDLEEKIATVETLVRSVVSAKA